jgi:DNA-binding transcriptional LysR family regulator
VARANPNDLVAFLAVARDRSFTRAAARLGVTPSALSHTVRGLEERLGVRLLNRTTRSVTPTEAGERLLERVGPRFDEIEAEIAALGELRDKPAGNIRITTDPHAIETVLWPKLRKLLVEYPDINVELVSDYGLKDISAEGYDAGVRLGELVAKDMITVPISPEMRLVAVASPSYFARRPIPQAPQELSSHRCINFRQPTSGGLYAWEFEKNGRELRVRVDGQLVFSSNPMMLQAALGGFGLAYLFEDEVQPHVQAGTLIQVLSDWSPPFPGYHLYYPSRRQHTPAFTVLVDALRYRAE